jgi:uncharacterized DUF497 family protein
MEVDFQFQWDETKRQYNIEKHGIDFVDAAEIFDDVRIEFEDSRRRYGEPRMCTFGFMQGQLICVIYTLRNEEVRLISARKANEREKRKYDELFKRAIAGDAAAAGRSL